MRPRWRGSGRGWRPGEEELVPAAVVDRLLAGESPVRVWREHRGLTQSGLARASGVNRVVVADIEAGRKGGSVRSLQALAAALGVGVDDLALEARSRATAPAAGGRCSGFRPCRLRSGRRSLSGSGGR